MRHVPRLAPLALTLLGACSFDPHGANVLLQSADASLPFLDGGFADATVADASVDASIDATPSDAAIDAAPDAEVPAGCGDGVVEPPEQCDDHNTTSGDGCSSSCRWEPSACFPGAQLAELVSGQTVSGSTAGQVSGLSGGGTCGGGTSGEDIYTFELSERSDVLLTTALPGTMFNTALYVRSDCNDPTTQVGCSSQGQLGDVLMLAALNPGSYFGIVDGFGGASGAYQLRLTVRAIRGLGAPCDPFGETSRCDDGLMCRPIDNQGNARCFGGLRSSE